MPKPTDLPIVVVEDDPDVLSLIAALLGAHVHHNILTFEESPLALAFLRESEAAAVVLDLAMPGMTGQDILQYLCAEKPHIPAVIVTGERQIETAVDCMKTGAVDYLTKPVQVEKLIASVTRALNICGGKQPAPAAPHAVSPVLSSAAVPERLRKAVDYMKQHLSKELYVDTVAQQACMSKFHFAREFKRYFGVSPMQYMLRLRIARATSLLTSSETPVSRVANECGFSDQSEFTKWFKKSTGVTPSRFRNSLGPEKENIRAPRG
jgi:YesN/AraC family two-component response regulator